MAIADDLVGYAHVAYLGDPFEQYCGLNGKPLIGGWIEVYHAGTDSKYITMQNFDGAMNPFKIPLNADGRVVMLADPSLTYDIYVKNSYGDLVCSRLNVECTCPGNISISGLDTWVRNTDGTLNVSLQTSANNRRVFTVNSNSKLLDVQDPLYFVENSNTATVIGFSGDSSSSISGKMDVSKLEYNAYGEISAYNGSAFASQGGGGAGDPEVNELVHSNSATWNDVSAKLDTTAFSTVSGSFLTAISDDYATKDYVQSSVSSKLDSTAFSTVSGSFLTSHQDLSDYATTAELADKLDTTAFSDVSGTFLTAHQDISQYAKTADLTAYQEKGDYYSASNPSGFLNKSSADTLYQLTGDYATHDDLTAYQPTGDYANATALDGKVDTSSFTAFSSTTNEKIEYISGALSGTYELSAGEGIDITDYPNEQKTVISVTAQGGSEIPTAVSGYWQSASDTVCANSGAWGGSALPVSAGKGVKISLQNDTLVFSNDETVLWSGDALSATLSESIDNFEKFDITYTCWPGKYVTKTIYGWSGQPTYSEGWTDSTIVAEFVTRLITNDSHTVISCDFNKFWNPPTGNLLADSLTSFAVNKVIGINRIAGGN